MLIPEFIQERRGVLLAKKTEIEQWLSKNHTPEFIGRDIERGDEFNLRIVSRQNHHQQIQTLQDVSEALQRIEQGTFSICQDCGKKILQGRLVIIPWAKRCSTCQTRHEKDRGRRYW